MGTKLVPFTSRQLLCKTSTRPSKPTALLAPSCQRSLLVLLTIFPPKLNHQKMLLQLPKGRKRRNLRIHLAVTPPPPQPILLQGGLHHLVLTLLPRDPDHPQGSPLPPCTAPLAKGSLHPHSVLESPPVYLRHQSHLTTCIPDRL